MQILCKVSSRFALGQHLVSYGKRPMAPTSVCRTSWLNRNATCSQSCSPKLAQFSATRNAQKILSYLSGTMLGFSPCSSIHPGRTRSCGPQRGHFRSKNDRTFVPVHQFIIVQAEMLRLNVEQTRLVEFTKQGDNVLEIMATRRATEF